MQMGWLSVVLAGACLGVGLLHLVRLLVVRADPAGEVAHAAMGFGMAAMFSPAGDPVPGPAWMVVFGPCAAWFAAVALRSGCSRARHHVVGSGAMLFMLLGGHSHAPGAAGAAHAGHAGHAGGMGVGSVVAIVLAGYFAWHVLRCADRWGESAQPVPAVGGVLSADGTVAVRTPVPTVGAPRTAALAHLVMAAAMTVMLLGMV